MIKQTPKTTPSRSAKRATYDQATIYSILDEAMFCTISYSVDNQPFSIPTAFVRKENKLFIHGSVGSHFLREIEKGIPVCITVMLVDDLVVARSAFHHSVNYRSVIIFSKAERIDDFDNKWDFFKELTEKIVPNCWEYLRPMKAGEVNKTMLLSFDISEASAKIRQGMPNDDEEDQSLPIWSGIIPVPPKRLTPVADDFSKDIPLPDHLKYHA
ncbi:MAG: pyridoxamine 5'-phosphate oxidase family protein [Spirosomataceae bacterium]|jgi:nitroimidazol reductase NimA-like FMN-containing flavoprotein (pyridoxamine 5'-phosphate oxidase superfamily)